MLFKNTANAAVSTVFAVLFSFAAMAGMRKPRCSPMSTNAQWDMDRCIFCAKDTFVMP